MKDALKGHGEERIVPVCGRWKQAWKVTDVSWHIARPAGKARSGIAEPFHEKAVAAVNEKTTFWFVPFACLQRSSVVGIS
jgi:hypothetical protein